MMTNRRRGWGKHSLKIKHVASTRDSIAKRMPLFTKLSGQVTELGSRATKSVTADCSPIAGHGNGHLQLGVTLQ